MLKKIALLFVIAIAAVLGLAVTKPDTFRVERSASIKAPPEKIFAIVNDFHNWPSWSPWAKLDPAMKTTYSGPASGKGAVSTWDGNSEVGSGRIEITDSSPPSKVAMKLDMIKPMAAQNIVEYTLTPKDGATNVAWAMHGQQPFLGKVMSVFIDCDKMVGKSFEEGLANLKALAEK